MQDEWKVEFFILSETKSLTYLKKLLDKFHGDFWEKGDSNQGSLLKRKEYGWILSISDKGNIDLQTVLSQLIKLVCIDKVIQHLHNDQALDSGFACCFYMYKNTPSINLDPELLEKITKLRASLDIDIIDMTETR